MSRGTERQKCLTAFQLLRRLEESDNWGRCECIVTGQVKHYKEMHGGHYISRKCLATEMDKDNVWPQCPGSNFYGGEADKLIYREKLIKKMGVDRVERLESLYQASRGSDDAIAKLSEDDMSLLVIKSTEAEYKEIRKEIMKKVKDLQRKKNI